MMPLPGRHGGAVRRSRALCVLLAGVLAIGLLLASDLAVPAGPSPAAASSGEVMVRATVDRHTPKVAIPRHFIGVSFDLVDTLGAIGSPGTTGGRVDAPLARLFRNITDAGNGAPILRIGAGSADHAWWDPDGAPQPLGITYDITADFVDGLRNFHSLAHIPYILTLNFAKNRPQIAVNWARAAVNGLGRNAIRAFEIGNEPDLYPEQYYYDNHKTRPTGWGFSDYLDELGVFSRRLKNLRSWLPLAGPVACCKHAWDRGLPQLLDRFRNRLSLVTWHQYPFCDKEHSATLSFLLAAKTFQDAAARLGPLALEAKRHGRQFRVTETTPNACRPDPRYAVALWATDWMFAFALRGVSGVDSHQMGTTPFSVGFVNAPLDPHFEASVSPLYYSMLLVARAVPNGARLIPYATFGERLAKGENATVWATIDRDGTVRVVVNNKRNHAGYAVINVIGARRRASLQRLRGQDVSAREGVTLAGQAVANPTRTGILEGQKQVQHVARRNGRYRFRMPAFSVALLTIGHVG
jgi:hypothetical protein